MFLQFHVASVGRVTSQMVAATTPIAGTILNLTVNPGDRVQRGQVIATVENHRVNRARLEDLHRQRAAASARLDSVGAERTAKIHECARQRSMLQQRARYRALELAAQLREATSRSSLVRANLAPLRAENEANNALLAEHLVPPLERDRTRGRLDANSNELQAQDAVIERLAVYVRALAEGVFLGADIPVEASRVDELTLRVADLNALHEELTKNIADLDGATTAEQQELAKMAAATVTSPVSGYVFRRTASSGEYVPAGAVLVEVVDAASIRVEASIHQRYLRAVPTGAGVTVSPVGTLERLRGTVLLITADESVRSPTVAGQFATNQDKPMRVLISLDPPDQQRVWVGQAVKIAVGESLLSDVLLFLAMW